MKTNIKILKLFFLFVLCFFSLCFLHGQSRVETYAWMYTKTDTCRSIVRIYENDSTFMEIGMFFKSDTAWYKIRNGKWFMKNHDKDSFALFFDTSFVNDTTPTSWSYPMWYNNETWSLSEDYCNVIRPYYWKRENKFYNGYPVYRLFYWDVRYDPPMVTYYKSEDGIVKKRVCVSSRYIHPPIYYFFTYQLGIFGSYSDVPVIRKGIDIIIP